MTWTWIVLGVLSGIAAGYGTWYLAARRHPVLLYPADWLVMARLRRQRRKMTDHGGRTRS